MHLPNSTRAFMAVLLTTVCLSATPAIAATLDTASNALPAAQMGNGITYITGGIGDEERVAIENSADQYNLHITNVNNEGAFTDNMNIAIYDMKATKLAEFNAGPMIYAKLPAGKYVVAATNENGEVRRKNVRVLRTTTNVNLVW